MKGNELIAPILAVAGQDISHWFNSRTGDIKTHVDAEKVCPRSVRVRGNLINLILGNNKILLSTWTFSPCTTSRTTI